MDPHLQKNLERLERISREAKEEFGHLSKEQLNWKPAPGRWSIAQCLDHLITTNDEYWPQLEAVAGGAKRANLWERLPLLPDLVGGLLLRSTRADRSRKMKTAPIFEPAYNDLPADKVEDFIQHNEDLADLFCRLDGQDLRRTRVTTPVLSLLNYRLHDAIEVIVQHEERHLNQAREVMRAERFPGKT